MKNRTLLAILVVLLTSNMAWSQSLTQDEVVSLKELAKYNDRWNAFLNIWAFLGPLLAFIATWLGLRKKAEEWAEKEITKKASEKFGVEWGVVNQLVVEKKRDNAIKAKRLAIVNKQTGRRQDLVIMLDKYGFKNPPPQYFNLTDFNAKFDYNHFDLVVLDNHDGLLSEDEMQGIIEKHQFPYVLFTAAPTNQSFFKKFKDRVKFAQIQENIPEYVAQSF